MGFFIVFIVRIFSWHTFGFSCFNVFFRFFPVDRHDKILIALGCVNFQQSIGLFRIVAAEKEPAMRLAFSCMTQIEIDPRAFNLESQIHFAIFFFH